MSVVQGIPFAGPTIAVFMEPPLDDAVASFQVNTADEATLTISDVRNNTREQVQSLVTEWQQNRRPEWSPAESASLTQQVNEGLDLGRGEYGDHTKGD